MNSNDLVFFLAVHDAGGVGRAAAQLNTVQSNVTSHLLALERELGGPLFYRGPKGTTPTPAGERLLPYAREMVDLISRARDAVVADGAPRGRLRVGSLETMAALRLPPMLAAYNAAFPAVEIDLATGPTAFLVEEVVERRRDVAFVSGPVRHEALETVLLLDEELVLAVPGGCAEAGDPPGRVLAGAALRPLMFRSGCAYRTMLERWLADEGLSDLQRMEFGTLDGILGCIAAGMGFSLLPRPIVERAAADGVGLIALPRDRATSPTTLITRRDSLPAAAAVEFLAMARGMIGGTPAPCPTDERRRALRVAVAK